MKTNRILFYYYTFISQYPIEMKKIFIISLLGMLGLTAISQDVSKQHQPIVKSANNMFDSKEYDSAKKNFSQLISFYPKNAEFNYKFGACNVMLGGDPEASITHLTFAIASGFEKDAKYYLGRAYHRNYDFNEAILAFQKYKMTASKDEVVEREVDMYIEMCRNGKGLLSSIKDVVVLDKKIGTDENFFRFYDLSELGGKILSVPEELRTKLDKKKNFVGVIYFAPNDEQILFASYGKTGNTGKDIYEAHLLPNGKFGRVKKLGGDINTKYDEDYAILHSDKKSLYFSSKGHNSMGGYDIFRAQYDEGTSNFQNATNLDFAVNTPDDDVFYIADKNHKTAWFSSGRNLADGDMNVYSVKVEGIPINLIFIQGNFIADFDGDIKNAKIVLKDELTGRTVSNVKTNSSTGDYILSLTKPGLYKIEVESEHSPITHEGYIQIPSFDKAVALGQELKLIKESGQEKLIINNSFNIPLDADIAGLSKEFLRRKAGLEISEETEDEIYVDNSENVHIEKVMGNATLAAGFSEGITIEQILFDSEIDADEIQRELDEIEVSNKAAYSYAIAKQGEANSRLKESKTMMDDAEGLEGDLYRSQVVAANRLLIEADELSTDAKAAYRIAKRSELIADNKTKDLSEIVDHNNTVTTALTTDDFDAATKALRWEKDRLNSKNAKTDLNPGEIARQEASALERKQSDLLNKVKLLSDEQTSLNIKLRVKKEELAKLSKKKEVNAANESIALLAAREAEVDSKLLSSIKEVKVIGQEEVILVKEAEFYENQYINPEDIYLTDLSTDSYENLHANLDEINQTIGERKRGFASNPKIFKIINEEIPETTAWSDTNTSSDYAFTDVEKTEDISDEEDIENYQVMIAIENEVSRIDNDMDSYLAVDGQSKEDEDFLKMVSKKESLNLQHDDIYNQQISEISANKKDVVKIITDVDPRYNKELQMILANEDELDGSLKAREYRMGVKDQLVFLAENNKKEILTEDNPRELKKLIKKDVAYSAAISDLDEEINDVSLFKIAYEDESKAIIDTNRPVAETLPYQIELTDNYIQTLEKMDLSIDEEIANAQDDSRKTELQLVKDNIAQELVEANNKLVSYDSDLNLTDSTEDFTDLSDVDFSEEYVPLTKSSQGIISNLRTEYKDVFSSSNGGNELSMNDKISSAIDQKMKEQRYRINNSFDSEEKAILKMDMQQLRDLKEKVDSGQYIFATYREPNVADASTEKVNEELALNDTNEASENKSDVVRTVQDVDEEIIDEVIEENSDIVTNDIQNDETIEIVEDVVTELEILADHQTAEEVNENITNDVATSDVISEKKDSYVVEEVVSNKTDETIVDVVPEKTVTKTRRTAESLLMEDLIFGLAKSEKKDEMEAYGTNIFDDAVEYYNSGEEEFTNLDKIRSIQDKIVLLENRIASGEEKSSGTKIEKKIEKLYTDLAFEEIKLANRLENYSNSIIETSDVELKEIEKSSREALLDESDLKSQINVLESNIKKNKKNAANKRAQIGRSDDEVERNHLAREAFAMESSIIEDQEKLKVIYSNVDEIVKLEDATIEAMRTGDYVYDGPTEETYEETVFDESLIAAKSSKKSTPSSNFSLEEKKQMESIAFGLEKPVKVAPLEAYGTSTFDEAEVHYSTTDQRFSNLTKIREIQTRIIALENAVVDGEVKNNERKLNKQFESLYTDLAYEEIKLANRLGEYSVSTIASQAESIKMMEMANKSKLEQDPILKAELKALQSDVDSYSGTADKRRTKIKRAKDEMERNFYAREAFSYEASAIENQRKIITIYENLDQILSMDEATLAEMRGGNYVFENSLASGPDVDMTSQVNNDLQTIVDGGSLNYTNTHLDYIDHLKVVGVKMKERNELKTQEEAQNTIIYDLNKEINVLQTQLDGAKNKNERKKYGDKLNEAKSKQGDLQLSYNNINEKVVTLDQEILADKVKAEYLFAKAEVRYSESQEEFADNNESINKNSEEFGTAKTEKVAVETETIEDDTTEVENVESIIDTTTDSFVEDQTVSRVSEETNNETIVENDSPVSNVEVVKASNVESSSSEGMNFLRANEFNFLNGTNRRRVIPMDITIPDGTVYRIQVGAFSNPLDPNTFAELDPISGETVGNGVVRYVVGFFVTYDAASNVLDGVHDLGYKDAFVVAYKNGKRISIGNSIQYSKEVVSSLNTSKTDTNGIGVLLDYYNSFPNAAKAKIITPESGLFYTVQVGVFKQPVTAAELNNTTPLNIDILPSKKIRYSVGRYEDLSQVLAMNDDLNQKGFPDAFVTAYKDGKRIAVSKAKQYFGDESNTSATSVSESQSNANEKSASVDSDNKSVVSENESVDSESESSNQAKSNNSSSLQDQVNSAKAGEAYVVETPIKVNTKITQVTQSGEGVSVTSMEYDVLLGQFPDGLPSNIGKAVEQLKTSNSVKEEMIDGQVNYHTERVGTLQEVRNIQAELKARGIEGTEIRAFKVK